LFGKTEQTTHQRFGAANLLSDSYRKSCWFGLRRVQEEIGITIMAAMGLFNSCAAPPTSWPMEASFSDSVICACKRFRLTKDSRDWVEQAKQFSVEQTLAYEYDDAHEKRRPQSQDQRKNRMRGGMIESSKATRQTAGAKDCNHPTRASKRHATSSWFGCWSGPVVA